MLKLKLLYLATWCKELTHLKRPWCWARLKARGEGDDRGWDGWMASPTQWTWTWANSGRCWGTGNLSYCSPWGQEELDTTWWLNNNDNMLQKEILPWMFLGFSSVQLLSCVWLFATSWTAACQASLSFIISWSLLKFTSIESVMPSNHLILSSVIPFSSCLQSFPASGSFPMRQLFPSGGQSIGASASKSVLPMNIQGWCPLWLTGLISLLSKGLSGVFCSTTVQKHQFFGAQPFFMIRLSMCILSSKSHNNIM